MGPQPRIILGRTIWPVTIYAYVFTITKHPDRHVVSGPTSVHHDPPIARRRSPQPPTCSACTELPVSCLWILLSSITLPPSSTRARLSSGHFFYCGGMLLSSVCSAFHVVKSPVKPEISSSTPWPARDATPRRVHSPCLRETREAPWRCKLGPKSTSVGNNARS